MLTLAFGLKAPKKVHLLVKQINEGHGGASSGTPIFQVLALGRAF